MKATTRSPESYNGVPTRLDTVDKFIFDGLQARVFETFNTPSVWTTSTDKVRSVDKLFGKNGKEVSYPYAFLVLNTWTRSEDRMNLKFGTLRGTRVAVSDDMKSTIEIRFMPVDFQVTMEFVTNNFKDITDFGRRWLLSSTTGRLNFQVEYGSTSFDVRSVLDGTVNFPKREADPENVQEYQAETSLVIQGFISESEPVQQGVIDTVSISAATGLPSDPATGTFWKFDIPKKQV